MMKFNQRLELNQNTLHSETIEEMAKSIYFELIESSEALKFAEMEKEQMEKPNTYTIEDILWEVAYYNAENLYFVSDVEIDIKFRRN